MGFLLYYRWCINSEEINDFFSVIKKEVPGIKSTNAPINFTAFQKVQHLANFFNIRIVWR